MQGLAASRAIELSRLTVNWQGQIQSEVLSGLFDTEILSWQRMSQILFEVSLSYIVKNSYRVVDAFENLVACHLLKAVEPVPFSGLRGREQCEIQHGYVKLFSTTWSIDIIIFITKRRIYGQLSQDADMTININTCSIFRQNWPWHILISEILPAQYKVTWRVDCRPLHANVFTAYVAILLSEGTIQWKSLQHRNCCTISWQDMIQHFCHSFEPIDHIVNKKIFTNEL